MQPADFTAETSGRLVQGLGGYWAFVPDPLPPRLAWTPALASLLSAADRALGRLGGVGEGLSNPQLLIKPFVRREAVLSSRIEGTQASLSDLFVFEAARPEQPEAPDVREVANYVNALEYGLRRCREMPVCIRLFRELHARLMRGVRGDDMQLGEFRNRQNWIGPPGSSLADALYVPPPVDEMQAALTALERYMNTPTDLPPLVRLAMVHYQFEAIHPFVDGNGRIGRLLITLLLCVDGVLSQPLLYLSAYFERKRADYYRLLREVSCRGAWPEWIGFFLRGVAEEATDAVDRARRLRALQDGWHKKLHSARASALLLKLVDELFRSPAVSATGAMKLLGVTHRAAQQNINKLVKAGILTEVTGQKRNRVYMAEEIIKALEKTNPAV